MSTQTTFRVRPARILRAFETTCGCGRTIRVCTLGVVLTNSTSEPHVCAWVRQSDPRR